MKAALICGLCVYPLTLGPPEDLLSSRYHEYILRNYRLIVGFELSSHLYNYLMVPISLCTNIFGSQRSMKGLLSPEKLICLSITACPSCQTDRFVKCSFYAEIFTYYKRLLLLNVEHLCRHRIILIGAYCGFTMEI